MGVLRRLAALVATVVAAAALGHVFLAVAISDEPLGSALTGTPAWLIGVFVHADLGETGGGGCPRRETNEVLCASYPAADVADMLRERAPIDLSLVVGGMLLGSLAGVAGGRWCATRPRSPATRVLHVATALLLSSPPFLLALLALFSLSSNVSELVRLPFLSGAGDYVPFREDALGYVKAMWLPWVLVALPLAAFLLRLTEATLREQLQEDYVRTARAKGVRDRRVVDRHALLVTVPALATMAGMSVSTLLLNAAVVEFAYSIPGMFHVIYTVARHQDVAVMEAMILEGVLLVTLANFAADAIQSRLDPRLARSGA